MKRALVLGPEESPVTDLVRRFGWEAIRTSEKLDAAALRAAPFDLVLSHGYRHIIRPAVIELFPDRIYNLHVSLLPWNRGADPNLWSFLEETPRGVTIHRIDAGLDTGDVVAARPVVFDVERETLATSYARLQAVILDLLIEIWPALSSGAVQAAPQEPGGSCHRSIDKEPYLRLLANGWDTPVSALLGRALGVAGSLDESGGRPQGA